MDSEIKKVNTDIEYNISSPVQIKKIMDKFIVGQHTVKEIISTAAYNHFKRIKNIDNCFVEKSNILLIGPTGTGKTLFAKTLSSVLRVPFINIDATSLTESGYVGEDIESIFERLIINADYDIQQAQNGIVFIDEIDKKAKFSQSTANSKDVSGEGVQQSLLRVIEGAILRVKTSNKKSFDSVVEFDTKNILFIVSGAFVGLDKITDSEKQPIGFRTAEIKHKSTVPSTKDLIDYGLIPELLGRLPVIAKLDSLTKKDMIKIINRVENNLLDQYKALLSLDGLDLEVGQQFLEQCADFAISQDMGARGLRQILEGCFTSIMFRAPDLEKLGVRKIFFNKYPVLSYKPTLVFDDHEEIDKYYKLYREF